MHVLLSAEAEGIQFGDGMAGGAFLSKRLRDVGVLILARYSGESDPAWAQMVTHAPWRWFPP